MKICRIAFLLIKIWVLAFFFTDPVAQINICISLYTSLMKILKNLSLLEYKMWNCIKYLNELRHRHWLLQTDPLCVLCKEIQGIKTLQLSRFAPSLELDWTLAMQPQEITCIRASAWQEIMLNLNQSPVESAWVFSFKFNWQWIKPFAHNLLFLQH